MKAKAELSARNGYACLERVAEHLYRHRLNGSYYGRMKVAGKRIIKALRIAEDTAPTTDRPTANRLLREWEDSLSRVDASSGDMRLEALLAKFAAARAGKAQSTRITEAALISRFRADFGRNEEGRRVFGMDQMVSRVKPSDVSLFLAGIANSGVRNATHNRYRLILRKLFQFAVDDRVIAQSPFIEGRNPPKKKQKVFRNIPTAAEFEKIINDIRTPTLRPTKGKHGGARMMSFPESADFAEFLGRAGLGQAEAQALKWGHVDFKNRRLKIVRRKTGEYFEVPIYAALLPLLGADAQRSQGHQPGGGCVQHQEGSQIPHECLQAAGSAPLHRAQSSRHENPRAVRGRRRCKDHRPLAGTPRRRQAHHGDLHGNLPLE